tara:strand:- start:142 stop:357 length:216 start_codon:yes stop_codon:yes gene_type:complete
MRSKRYIIKLSNGLWPSDHLPVFISMNDLDLFNESLQKLIFNCQDFVVLTVAKTVSNEFLFESGFILRRSK